MADQGFETHLWTEANPLNAFNTTSITCSPKPVARNVGCSSIGDGKPPTADQVEAIYDRTVYDADPYNSCDTDENVSFRQYLEGFTKTDYNPICVLGGCQMHGLGHIYVGGEMAAGAGSPNDPIFFMHHANIDRLWAMWQDNNRASSETAENYGNPGFPDDWRGKLFNFTEVRADETFDFRSLGYRYDTNQTE